MRTLFALALSLSFTLGCTFHHSKQGLLTAGNTPSERARFITEEDSGLALFGLFHLSEPDHYAVLLERARRKHQCASLHDAQLDFYTDYWIVLSFPITRITLICDPESGPPKAGKAVPAARPPAPHPGPPPASVPPPAPAESAAPPAAAPPPAAGSRQE